MHHPDLNHSPLAEFDLDGFDPESFAEDTLDQNCPAPCICLVTGCAGFLGSHLARALLAQGHGVIGLDDLSSGSAPNMADFSQDPRFVFLHQSVALASPWGELFQKHGPIHTVFHLAALVGDAGPGELDLLREVNLEATLRLLEAAETGKAARFVFAGSAAEYGGGHSQPLREALAPRTGGGLRPYAATKLMASLRVGQSPIGVALRLFNVFGPGQSPDSPYSGLVARFIDQALADRPLAVPGPGERHRDYLYVQDAVQAFLTAAGLGEGRALPPGVYNVGAGRATRLEDLARMVLVLADRPGQVQRDQDRPSGQDPTPTGLHSPPGLENAGHLLADITAITGNSGWRPEVMLSVGLARSIAWRRQQLYTG